MKQFIYSLAVVGLLSGCSDNSSPAPDAGYENPLIGNWTLDSGPIDVCGSAMVFTTDAQTISYVDKKRNATSPATYTVRPKTVYVSHDRNNELSKYDFTGRDAMLWTGGHQRCTYHRAGTAARVGKATPSK